MGGRNEWECVGVVGAVEGGKAEGVEGSTQPRDLTATVAWVGSESLSLCGVCVVNEECG